MTKFELREFVRYGPTAMASRAKPKSAGQSSASASASVFRPETATIVSSLLAWFARNARDLPWRRTLDPYGIWISEIMLQQTQVKTVIPFWERWMTELPDVETLARAPQARVLKLWEGLGYYTRARNLQKAAQVVSSEHGGVFPGQHAAVLALPGIGRYTAGAICSIAYNQPAPIVDGNVIRVLTRLFGISENPRDKAANQRLWQIAESLVHQAAVTRLPKIRSLPFPLSGPCSALNQSLMELGALICTPRQPRCPECPLRSDCRAFDEDRIAQWPNVGPRIKPTDRRFVAFAIEHRGRWLVRQRPAGQVNAHLWEFPAFEVDGAEWVPATLFAREFQTNAAALTPLPVIRHSITRYRMTLTPFRAQLKKNGLRTNNEFAWRTAADIEALALTSAHRKLWRKLVSLPVPSLEKPGKKAD